MNLGPDKPSARPPFARNPRDDTVVRLTLLGV
jgi:hypothetical protein